MIPRYSKQQAPGSQWTHVPEGRSEGHVNRRAKYLGHCPTGGVFVAVLATWVWAQQPSPALPVQPLGEAEVARQFEEQAPELFRQWVERRPTELRALALGQWNDTDQSATVSCPRETS